MKPRTKYDKLVEAVQTGKIRIVRRALKQGRNPSYRRDKYDHTLLHWAVQENQAKVVRLLVKYGADMQKTATGSAPLTNAAGEGNLQMVQLLVELGAEVNYSPQNRGTALLIAAAYGNEEVARFLIASGADTNAPEKREQTPLFYAARNGHLNMVNLLLSAGANKELRDKKGRTAADVARKKADKSIALKKAIIARLAVTTVPMPLAHAPGKIKAKETEA